MASLARAGRMLPERAGSGFLRACWRTATLSTDTTYYTRSVHRAPPRARKVPPPPAPVASEGLQGVDLIPRDKYGDRMVMLNVVPMKEEEGEDSPSTVLLHHPQLLLLDFCVEHGIPALVYRMDAGRLRGRDVRVERQRFMDTVDRLPPGSLVVTESRAVEAVHAWTSSKPVDLTTFSIAMCQHHTQGRLQEYVDGLVRLTGLKDGDRVLIAETCERDEIEQSCEMHGRVIVPEAISKLVPGVALDIHHAYGQDYTAGDAQPPLSSYQLVVQCSGCRFLTPQLLQERLEACRQAGVAVTNYGLLLSYAASPCAFERSIHPYECTVTEGLEECTQVTGQHPQWPAPKPAHQRDRGRGAR